MDNRVDEMVPKEGSVLVVGGSSGSGHMRAAANLVQTLNSIAPGIEAEQIDIFDHLPSPIRLILGDLWQFSSLNLKHFYQYAHSIITAKKLVSDPLRAWFFRVVAELIPFFAGMKPSAFIATHPAAAIVGSSLRRISNAPLCVVPTDYVLHNFHVSRNVDFYYIPPDCRITSDDSHLGGSSARLVTTGIPLSPSFWRRKDKIQVRAELGLEASRTTVLVSFGGKGLGAERHMDTLLALLANPLPLQFIIVTGENEFFRRRLGMCLSKRPDAHRFLVLGFVANMGDLLNSSDIFIGKAGGLSISEALAHGLPIGILEALPGQEWYNKQFLIERDLGIEGSDLHTLLQWLSSLLVGNNLERGRLRALAYSRPLSSYHIVRHVLSLLGKECIDLDSETHCAGHCDNDLPRETAGARRCASGRLFS